MKKLAIFASSFSVLAFPAIAFADDGLADTITKITALVNSAIPLLIGLTILVFFYGLFQYVWQQNEETGKNVMIAGLISLFVMVSLWGIIKLAQNTVGIKSTDTSGVTIPKVPAQK